MPPPPVVCRAVLALAGALLALGPSGHAASAPGQFSATTELVEVYATVTDGRGRPVRGLTLADFTVLDQGEAQPITTFAEGDFPLTVAAVVDRSFSMGGARVDAARAGARRLVDQLRLRDRLIVLAIGGNVETLAGFEASREAAREALGRVGVWGSSPIGDTVARAIDAVAAETGRRAVVLFTDGVEREAIETREAVLDRVRASGVLVYPIAVTPAISPLLGELSALSGGRVQVARDRRSAERAASSVTEELRHQYLLGYAPPAGASGWRGIEVQVARPEVVVRARRGYVAPPAAPGAASGAKLASKE